VYRNSTPFRPHTRADELVALENPIMKRVAPVMVLLLLVSSTLFAAEDISGKWAGTLAITVDGKPAKNDPTHLVLKQTDATVTGTAGPNKDDQQITVTGKVETVRKDGKDVTNVTMKWDVPGGAPALNFVLTVVDGQLKGPAETQFEGRKMVFTLDAARLK